MVWFIALLIFDLAFGMFVRQIDFLKYPWYFRLLPGSNIFIFFKNKKWLE